MNFNFNRTHHLSVGVMGELSGYPTCCRAIFHIRWTFFKIIGWKFWQYYIKFNPEFFEIEKLQHVTCIFHTCYYMKNDPKYKTCKDCGWDQLGKQDCNICLIENKVA